MPASQRSANRQHSTNAVRFVYIIRSFRIGESGERFVSAAETGRWDSLLVDDGEMRQIWGRGWSPGRALTGVRSAGPAALKLRSEVLDRLAHVMDEGRADEGRADLHGEPPLLTAEATVGGVFSVIHSRLLTPGSGALVDLLDR